MEKVPFSEAARLAGIHPNTIRNWRKAGKLKTCEKVFENGIEVWIVDPDEISQVALQKVTLGGTNNDNLVSTPDVKSDFTPAPPGPGFEQSLVFMRESVVKPLTDLVERQSNQIKEMSEEIGTLKERVRQLEAAQVTLQPSPTLKEETSISSDILAQIVPEPVKKGFWARVFGG